MMPRTDSPIPRRASLKALALACLAPLAAALPGAATADDWPARPVTLVAGFGTGGGLDSMTRAMNGYLAEELGVPVSVVNRPGAGTMVAATYVLNQRDDGYTLFSSTFSPYLNTAVLTGQADFTIEDFAYLNFQWFDFDLVATSADSRFSSLAELVSEIRDAPGKVRAAVVQGSAGHLITKLMLERAGIPQENLNLVTYNSGGDARTAVAGGQVDFFVIGAEGSEGVREMIRPLAIVDSRRHGEWDAPPLNEALAPLGIEMPLIPGAIRGFAVSAAARTESPEAWDRLVAAFQNVLSRKDVQEDLAARNIGSVWIGPERAAEMMKDSYQTFATYGYLLE
ncbi:tripartite tricarboxylate transporter substrate binding protein [Poseidonocella sp. HB161398]|uniref:tripartite tricarboxylate transporter substrate binding protein n=1 Tax=Poseidonocella sp. HB161398 TaxID=2320855 RepID=UPI0011096924|nr:tripartite tricarboxylate transporter substrate binding protein [Poseidonocella sp. HB161398]